jgi:hypothetical protein
VTATAQLEFNLATEAIGRGDAVPAPELKRSIPAGAARLLAALVREGGDADEMAELVLGLEESATVTASALQAPTCQCDHALPVRDEWEAPRCCCAGGGEA